MNCHSNSGLPSPVRAIFSRKSVGTIRQCVAIALVGALLGVCSPVLAGDFVPQKFNVSPAGLGVTLGLRSVPSGANAAFSLQDPNQQPSRPPTPPPQQQRSLTTKGKVLKWVGVGLMGSGGLTAGLGAAEYSSGNCSSLVINCSELRTAFVATGAVIAGVGAVLFFIGIHNKE
ncbi:MAG: hypothetical protein ABSG65_17840 [Bryobacteraceae bacterium]